MAQGFARRFGLIDWDAVRRRAEEFLRVFDVGDQYHPKEVGAFVPPRPARLMDDRPNRARVIQSCDMFVDAQRLVYSNDYNGGLFILEFEG